jgi:hypothetical protein
MDDGVNGLSVGFPTTRVDVAGAVNVAGLIVGEAGVA